MKFFEASDFTDQNILKECIRLNWHPEEIARMCNAKLKKDARVVYAYKQADSVFNSFSAWSDRYPAGQTHRALLIAIEPIVKCDHKDVEPAVWSLGHPDWYMMCKCGAKVKPNSYTEIK